MNLSHKRELYWQIRIRTINVVKRTTTLIVCQRGCRLKDTLAHANTKLQDNNSQALFWVTAISLEDLFNVTKWSEETTFCTSFIFTQTKKYLIKNGIMCSTWYVFHMIKCLCGLYYIGKTLHLLKQRIIKHLSSIRSNERDWWQTLPSSSTF